MSHYGLLSFCVAYVLAVASPGPGVAAVLARSLGHGMRGAPAFIAGFLIGDLVWFALAAAGLAALAQVAQTAFLVVRCAGVLYLLYLAYRLWTGRALSRHGCHRVFSAQLAPIS
jgi:threonine/homoserine/homoserine lactone efflux protein